MQNIRILHVDDDVPTLYKEIINELEQDEDHAPELRLLQHKILLFSVFKYCIASQFVNNENIGRIYDRLGISENWDFRIFVLHSRFLGFQKKQLYEGKKPLLKKSKFLNC